MTKGWRLPLGGLWLAVGLCQGGALGAPVETPDDARLPSGQFITPNSVPGVSLTPLNPHLARYPDYVAGQAMSQAVSPDGRTLLVLTSGFNSLQDPATGRFDGEASSEYLFVFDVGTGRPRERQVLQVATANAGIAFSPDGRRFYVGTGGGDGVVAFGQDGGSWRQEGPAIALGHQAGEGLRQGPSTAGLAVTGDGTKLVVADEFNDSVSVIDLAHMAVSGELDLRPGVEDRAKDGVAGGETPFWVATLGRVAFVSSVRDREVDVIDIGAAKPVMLGRIPVMGSPGKMLVDSVGGRLFVVADNDDSVQVIDTRTRRVVARVVVGPSGGIRYRGAAPNDLALSSDGRTLFVSNGGENAIALVDVQAGRAPRVIGLIPTGWYPNAVSLANGWLYVANSRSDPGPNPGHCTSQFKRDTGKAAYVGTCRANQYVLQLEGSSLQAFPVPDGRILARLTAQVVRNDGLSEDETKADAAMMAALHRRIRHVIYIIKENRTYDQILGDLGRGNGDASLVEFGRAVTPNFHALASQFVDLDNFEDSSEVSGNGWQWDLQARETDFNVKTVPLEYSRRRTNAPYDSEGEVRNVDVGLGSLDARRRANPRYPDDPNLLPGTASDDIADGPRDDEDGKTQDGLIWVLAVEAGLTVRSYGVHVTNVGDPADRDAFGHGDPQSICHTPSLAPFSDPFFRGFDQRQADLVRYEEWHREFLDDERTGRLPSLELVRLSHDHMGSFKAALDGVNTPELQQADDDYAVGRLVQVVARSRFKDDTLIFVIEDDAQDGPDHVDAHRSTAYVIGPYVKQGAVVSERYTTISMVRTIEDVLGIGHLSIFDAHQRPMTAVFDLGIKDWDFSAVPSSYLYATSLPLPVRKAETAPVPRSTHEASWWAVRTAGYDWSVEDRVPTAAFNALLWCGLKEDRTCGRGR